MTSVTVNAVQFDVILGDVAANVTAVMSKLGTINHGLVVLPEMWSCGFDNDRLHEHARMTPDILDRLKGVARQQGIVIAGSLPEYSGNVIYNTLYVIDQDGTTAGEYRKIHLFSPNQEHLYFGRGEKPVVCSTSVGRLGLMICYDLRFPELARALTEQGANMVVVSAQWPAARKEHWEVLLRARAIENQLFVVAVNRTGADPDLEFDGGSQVISPWGEVLGHAGSDDKVVSVTIDSADRERVREAIPCLTDRVPEAYHG